MAIIPSYLNVVPRHDLSYYCRLKNIACSRHSIELDLGIPKTAAEKCRRIHDAVGVIGRDSLIVKVQLGEILF